MSKRRGTQHLRARRNFGRGVAPGYAFTFTCASEKSDLEDARKMSHDLVIKLTGAHRRGGVEWLTWPAAEAPGVIAGVVEPEMWRHHLEFLEQHPGGFLVMARCLSTTIQPVKTGGPVQ